MARLRIRSPRVSALVPVGLFLCASLLCASPHLPDPDQQRPPATEPKETIVAVDGIATLDVPPPADSAALRTLVLLDRRGTELVRLKVGSGDRVEIDVSSMAHGNYDLVLREGGKAVGRYRVVVR